MSILGKKLQTLRKLQNDLTQESIANKIGVSTSAYAMYERGEREPDINTLIKLADFFNVSLDFLTDHVKSNLVENHSEIREGITIDYIIKSDLSVFFEKLRKSKELQALCSKLTALTPQQLRLISELADQMLK